MKNDKDVTKEQREEKLRILEKYTKLSQKHGQHPSITDMLKAGVDRSKIRYYFGSHTELKKAALEADPKAFQGIVDETLFTPKAFQRLRQTAGKYDRYVVTTAVAGGKLHAGFFAALTGNYEKRRKALTLILPCADPAAKAKSWDADLSDCALVFDDLALNENIFLSSIKLSAKHIDPITGLSRIGQRNGSFIYASPKQRLKFTPTSNVKLPHAMMTTGAITKPNYSTDRYMSERTAYIADHDHVIGGIVVEVVDDQLFHFRQVQADKRGAFIDLGVMYLPDGSTQVVRPEMLSLGDWHSGETCPIARKAFLEGAESVLQVTKPRKLAIHDGFNGRSISHHEIKDKVLRAQRAAKNQLSLQAELEEYARDLEFMASFEFIEEVVIVYSNHDDFLARYLSEARYVEDAQNHLLGLKLAAEMIQGKSPLKAFVEWAGIKNADKLRWLSEDEDYKIAGIEIGAHGHRGANGARGSLRAMENAYANSVSGHAHTAEILRGAWQNGTLSYLKLNYNRGPSSWTSSSTLIYPNGMRQLIHAINGQWRLKG